MAAIRLSRGGRSYRQIFEFHCTGQLCADDQALLLVFGGAVRWLARPAARCYTVCRLERRRLVKLQSSTRQVEGVTIVDLSGRITLGESSVVRDVVNDLMSKGNKKILLNLVDVNFIDSSGIGVLVSGFTSVRSQSGELKLLNPTKRIRDLLQITKLHSLFDVKDDEATAVASFR